jgi:hypothetical protein
MTSANPRATVPSPSTGAAWTFLTNHSHVLLCIASDPHARMREIAAQVGITERMVQKIIGDLVDGGYLTIKKEGRRNWYVLRPARPLRHPLEAHREVGDILDLLRRPTVENA